MSVVCEMSGILYRERHANADRAVLRMRPVGSDEVVVARLSNGAGGNQHPAFQGGRCEA